MPYKQLKERIVKTIPPIPLNPYQPDNKLQAAYDKLCGKCLCGHFESCSFCNGSMRPAREALEEAAEAIGYQLYRN